MHAIRIFTVLAMMTLVLGCGTVGDTPVDVQAPTSVENMRAALQEHAETGAPLGSGAMEMQTAIDEIRETDPAKAEALQQDYDQLMSMQNPNQIKAKSKEMLSKI